MSGDIAPWAKLSKDRARSHSLLDHSADVAAVVEALLRQPIIRHRLAAALGAQDLDGNMCAQLAALAFLHDVGKANRGFQARRDPRAPLVGHIDELAWLFRGEWNRRAASHAALVRCLGLHRIADWFVDEGFSMFDAVLAHHGRPARRDPSNSLIHWQAGPDGDPIASLRPLRAKLDLWFAEAFTPAPVVIDTPLFQHTFAGLLMLADWLGSDERFFPFADGNEAERIVVARRGAEASLAATGLAVEPLRAELAKRSPTFQATFAVAEPRAIQTAVTEVRTNLLVLEAETGSGKTEAALWRFKTLFEAGHVDGLYFALPTRVAATQMFERIKAFRDRIFTQGSHPGVVLAVPGQTMFDDAEARRLPGFEVLWSDERDAPERWAAETPKRFLAAPIAVGTIDQALLGAVKVKHAHLRGTLLLRHLLVVDEVHASVIYATELLARLLRSHCEAGGHALLLSATLGSAARARLLGSVPPDVASAERVPYPALSWANGDGEAHRPIDGPTTPKRVTITPTPIMTDPEVVAAQALEAARRGAKVLVIRNTVAAAIATAQAVEAAAGPSSALLFRCAGQPSVHHSRFAAEDRRRLDAAVEARLGKARESSDGCVVCGSQTLEISLDLDADLLITDLAPIDVLLQRIGRLHRHRRERPGGCEAAEVRLLVPPDRDLHAARLTRYGLGPLKSGGGIYPDLRVLEATWRLAERHPVWTVPAMCRALVEAATHPARLLAIEREDARFEKAGMTQEGFAAAETQAAMYAALDRSEPFHRCEFPADERFGTRLGEGDRLIVFDPPRPGPFGEPVTRLRLPAFLSRDVPIEAEPAEVVENVGMLAFRLSSIVFRYDRFGLVRET